jgi:hypothetical protein
MTAEITGGEVEITWTNGLPDKDVIETDYPGDLFQLVQQPIDNISNYVVVDNGTFIS